jgi:hypothetical protein
MFVVSEPRHDIVVSTKVLALTTLDLAGARGCS